MPRPRNDEGVPDDGGAKFCFCYSCILNYWRPKMNVDELDADSTTPVWVGFPPDIEKEGKIPCTLKEEEAALWLLKGWDVGFLADGVAEAESIKWIS
jgi:hypothetical protein